jgi:hypothetical protein
MVLRTRWKPTQTDKQTISTGSKPEERERAKRREQRKESKRERTEKREE